MKAVFDTNILIDYLHGDLRADKEVRSYAKPLISVISWMELLAGARDSNEDQEIREFLRGFSLIELNSQIREESVQIRRFHRVRLPDAIIWATAKIESCLLVTRNSRDFPKDDIAIRIPYHVHQRRD